MLEEKYFINRQWAETIRLYTGQLEGTEQKKFIELLSQKDILLACESYSTIFKADENLETNLTNIAIKHAHNILKPSESGKGLLALVELDKLREIADFFRSKKIKKNQNLYFAVISFFVKNSNETKVFELLKILAVSNIDLLNRMLDITLDLNIYPNGDITKGKELENILKERTIITPLIILKIQCLFELFNDTGSATKSFYIFLDNKQITYAEKLCKNFSLSIDSRILTFIEKLIEEKETKKTFDIIIKILNQVQLTFDKTKILIIISKSLNPKIKELVFNHEGSIISNDAALAICNQNIQIGNKSSIEFALRIIEEYSFQNLISYENIIDTLLLKPSYQKIEMAYKLVKENNLSNRYSSQYFFYLLVGFYNYQNLILARSIVMEDFNDSDREKYLKYILVLSYRDNEFTKLAKTILINDLYSLNKTKKNDVFLGFVQSLYKRKYSILYSIEKDPISITFKPVFLQLRTFIKFQFLANSPANDKEQIKILETNALENEYNNIWFENLYIGQIINFKVDSIFPKYILMLTSNYIFFKFYITIDEIINKYVKDINDYFKIGKVYYARIINFNKLKSQVFCSTKDINIKEVIEDETEHLFTEKISKLKDKYSR